jgi:hypothetical protein
MPNPQHQQCIAGSLVLLYLLLFRGPRCLSMVASEEHLLPRSVRSGQLARRTAQVGRMTRVSDGMYRGSEFEREFRARRIRVRGSCGTISHINH